MNNNLVAIPRSLLSSIQPGHDELCIYRFTKWSLSNCGDSFTFLLDAASSPTLYERTPLPPKLILDRLCRLGLFRFALNGTGIERDVCISSITGNLLIIDPGYKRYNPNTDLFDPFYQFVNSCPQFFNRSVDLWIDAVDLYKSTKSNDIGPEFLSTVEKFDSQAVHHEHAFWASMAGFLTDEM